MNSVEELKDYIYEEKVDLPDYITVDVWKGRGDEQECIETEVEIRIDHLIDYIDKSIEWESAFDEYSHMSVADKEHLIYDILQDIQRLIKDYMNDEDVITYYLNKIGE